MRRGAGRESSKMSGVAMGLVRSVRLSRSCCITFSRSVDMSPLHIPSGSATFGSS